MHIHRIQLRLAAVCIVANAAGMVIGLSDQRSNNRRVYLGYLALYTEISVGPFAGSIFPAIFRAAAQLVTYHTNRTLLFTLPDWQTGSVATNAQRRLLRCIHCFFVGNAGHRVGRLSA